MGGMRSFVVATIVLGSLAAGSPAAADHRTPAPPAPATFEVRESVGQLSVTGATPGATVEVLRHLGRSGKGGRVVQRATADAMGSALFRELQPDDGYSVRIGRAVDPRPRGRLRRRRPFPISRTTTTRPSARASSTSRPVTARSCR